MKHLSGELGVYPDPARLDSGNGAEEIRNRYVGRVGSLIGHFGTFGSGIGTLLRERMPAIMASRFAPSLLLLGRGSERFRQDFTGEYPELSDRLYAAGFVSRVKQLLNDEHERHRLGACAKSLYEERFALKHTIATLRGR